MNPSVLLSSHCLTLPLFRVTTLSLFCQDDGAFKPTRSRPAVASPRATDDRGPRRAGPPSTNKKKTKDQGRDDERQRRRQPLRVKNTGGKANMAEVIMRGRGSLRKRNRSRDKEIKEQKALERRTVILPE